MPPAKKRRVDSKDGISPDLDDGGRQNGPDVDVLDLQSNQRVRRPRRAATALAVVEASSASSGSEDEVESTVTPGERRRLRTIFTRLAEGEGDGRLPLSSAGDALATAGVKLSDDSKATILRAFTPKTRGRKPQNKEPEGRGLSFQEFCSVWELAKGMVDSDAESDGEGEGESDDGEQEVKEEEEEEEQVDSGGGFFLAAPEVKKETVNGAGRVTKTKATGTTKQKGKKQQTQKHDDGEDDDDDAEYAWELFTVPSSLGAKVDTDRDQKQPKRKDYVTADDLRRIAKDIGEAELGDREIEEMLREGRRIALIEGLRGEQQQGRGGSRTTGDGKKVNNKKKGGAGEIEIDDDLLDLVDDNTVVMQGAGTYLTFNEFCAVMRRAGVL
ncbi:hypothetical protein PYCC9005_001119 [Savitreella phatthalungensis]